MNAGHHQGDFEPLTVAEQQAVARLLALQPTSSELIAALHETFALEASVSGGAAERAPSKDTSAETTSTEIALEAPANEVAEAGPDFGAVGVGSLWLSARQIDPLSGAYCIAYWGETVSDWRTSSETAACWYAYPSQAILVPDWVMYEAWPEHRLAWDELGKRAWKRHINWGCLFDPDPYEVLRVAEPDDQFVFRVRRANGWTPDRALTD